VKNLNGTEQLRKSLECLRQGRIQLLFLQKFLYSEIILLGYKGAQALFRFLVHSRLRKKGFKIIYLSHADLEFLQTGFQKTLHSHSEKFGVSFRRTVADTFHSHLSGLFQPSLITGTVGESLSCIG